MINKVESFKADLSLLSKHKVALMGVSAVMILLHHTWLTSDFERLGIIGRIIYNGNCGVDIFLFLSGIGLYYSFSKDSRVDSFYRKRFLNIIPVSFLIIFTYVLVRVCLETQTLKEAVIGVIRLYENPAWFVIFIIFLYLLFPLLFSFFHGSRERSILRLIICLTKIVAICYTWRALDINSFSHVELAITRIPAFITGCWIGSKVQKGEKSLCWISLLLVALVFVVAKIVLPREFNPISSRFFLSCFGILLCFVVASLLEMMHKVWFRTMLSGIAVFFGKMSLEVYLTHTTISRVFSHYNMLELKYYFIIVICSITISIPLSVLRNAIYNKGMERK